MRILWVSPRWPFPADDGAKQATASLLLGLAKAGHELDVVTFERAEKLVPSPDPRIHIKAHYRADSHSKVDRILRVLRNMFGSLPVSAAPFARFELTWEKLRALLSEEPSCVVFDGNHGYASFVGKPCPWPLLYRAHNNETSLWEQAAAANSYPLKLYFEMQARRMRRLETQIGNVAKGIAAISLNDAADFRQWFPQIRVEWVPMGFQFTSPAPIPEGPITFGFLGRLDWPPNREGLIWFLKEIWPVLLSKRPEARLRIAGSGDSTWLHSFLSTFSPSGIEWLGKIDSVEPFYAGIHAALAPVHFGSGTKIKVVEAARFGRTLFATPQAIAGSGLTSAAMAIVSGDPSSWIQAMIQCQPNDLATIGAHAFTEASAAFSSESAVQHFLSLLS